MRVYVSVDMEGISGVTRWQDVITSGQDYQRARSWMTGDVNAAVEGAVAAGATDVLGLPDAQRYVLVLIDGLGWSPEVRQMIASWTKPKRRRTPLSFVNTWFARWANSM